MKTTLNKIKAFEPCDGGWEKLLTFLNKKVADDEELSLLTILESNGLNDALWALRAVDGFEKEIRLMACDFAESVVHLANDERCLNAIKVSKNYANGLAANEDLAAARDAAWDAAEAAWAAARDAAWDAAEAAAWAAAWDAAEAARAAARAASGVGTLRAVCLEQERQIAIFKKYVK